MGERIQEHMFDTLDATAYETQRPNGERIQEHMFDTLDATAYETQRPNGERIQEHMFDSLKCCFPLSAVHILFKFNLALKVTSSLAPQCVCNPNQHL